MSGPERIWATSELRRTDQGKWWDINPGGDSDEYIRADLVDPAAIREAALREAAAVMSRGGLHTINDRVRAILALIDKPAPDHSAGAGNMIDKGAG